MFSKAVIETMVKDMKDAQITECAGVGFSVGEIHEGSPGVISTLDGKRQFSQIGLFETENDDKNVPGHRLRLDRDIGQELFELQEKGIDVNAFLREALLERRKRIEQEKARISKEVWEKILQKMQRNATFEKYVMNLKKPSAVNECLTERADEFPKNSDSWPGSPKFSCRIPAQIVRLFREEYGFKCSIPTCQKPSRNHHYLQRFSVAPIHDPYFIAPLCSEHHTLAHGSDVKFAEIRSKYG